MRSAAMLLIVKRVDHPMYAAALKALKAAGPRPALDAAKVLSSKHPELAHPESKLWQLARAGYIAVAACANETCKLPAKRIASDGRRLCGYHANAFAAKTRDAKEIECASCHEVKPIEEFYPENQERRRRSKWCDECREIECEQKRTQRGADATGASHREKIEQVLCRIGVGQALEAAARAVGIDPGIVRKVKRLPALATEDRPCGQCGELGHNRRTCQAGATPKVAERRELGGHRRSRIGDMIGPWRVIADVTAAPGRARVHARVRAICTCGREREAFVFMLRNDARAWPACRHGEQRPSEPARTGPPRKHPEPKVGDVIGCWRVIELQGRGHRGRADLRLRLQCRCGVKAETYEFNARLKANDECHHRKTQ